MKMLITFFHIKGIVPFAFHTARESTNLPKGYHLVEAHAAGGEACEL
jgi:hypothetical protein